MRIRPKQCHRSVVKPLLLQKLWVFREKFGKKTTVFALNINVDIDTNWAAILKLIFSLRESGLPVNVRVTEETWKAIRDRKELLAGKADPVHAEYKIMCF